MNEVAIFAPKYPPDVGGAAIYFQQVVECLEDTDWNATVFAPRNDDAPKSEKQNDATIKRVFPKGAIHGGLFVPQFRRLLGQNDFDCLHVHPHFPQWRFYRHFVDTPIVFDCRDQLFNLSYVEQGDAYLSAGPPIDDILCDEVGVSMFDIYFSPVVAEIPSDRPQFTFTTVGPDAGFVGDLTESKGIYTAVSAVREYRKNTGESLNLHIYGDGPARQWIERKTKQPWLQYHGTLSHKKAIGAIDALDVLLLPSESEGCPRVVLEAEAVGTPVVATAVGSIPEIIGSNSRLAEKQITSVANGILCVLNQEPEYQSRTAPESIADVRKGVLDAYRDCLHADD